MTPPAAASTLAGTPARSAPQRSRPAPRPRRVSGPARAPARTAPARRHAPERRQEGLALWVLRSLENLSSHRLLDRLIRGRLWIGIIAFALIGIVTLQLGLLKLNSGIGRALERQATLQRENAALSIENSELAAGNRVESQAASRLGMKLVPLGGLRFLRSYPPSDIARAAAALRTPVQHSTEVPSSASAADEASSSQATGVAASGGQSQSAEQADSETATTSTSATQPEGTTTQGEAPAAAQTSTGEAVDPSATTPAQAPSEASGGGTAAPTG